MIRYVMLLVAIAALLNCEQSPESVTVTRAKRDFNTGWLFRQEGNENWQAVNLPHTMQIEPLVVNNQWQGKGFYEKRFSLSKADVRGKNVLIEFEGVMQEATVYLNGKFVTSHAGGYLPFVADITNFLLEDMENVLQVEVVNTDNPQVPPGKPLETLDFNMYGGIYRNVHLLIVPEVYITHPMELEAEGGGGLSVHFHEVTQEKASGNAWVRIRNSSNSSKKVQLNVSLIGSKGNVVRSVQSAREIGPAQMAQMEVTLVVEDPKLWSPETPNLYDLKAMLLVDGELLDEYTTRVGIRDVKVRADGFWLNGERRFLWGTNRHQEYPYVGYAITDNADWRDALKIKNAGFDFVRLSHYPHSTAFLDACDALGIIVMDAIPGWQWYLEDSTFQANAYRDIRHMVRRDRNHPSVMFWEVSLNESGMSEAFMEEANRLLKVELPYADTYSAGWIDHPSYDVYIPARQHGKAPDYWKNYKTDTRPLFIAEYGDWEYYAQNAGFNQKAFQDLEEEERTSRQLRAFGEKRLLQQALNYQEAANSNLKGPNTFGHANWLMFDYNRGYADDIESSGISDIFRIPKFAQWFYQSQRKPDELAIEGVVSGPMVKIATWWTEESSPIIKVYSNCDKVALYLNGKEVATQEPTIDVYSDQLPYPPFVFDVGEFKPGELRAVGFINDQEVASDIVRTPGAPMALEIQMDDSGIPLSKTGQDVVFVYARLVDDAGTVVPLNDVEVKFTIEGKGEWIGANPVMTEAGIATILLRTHQFNSPIKVQVQSGNMTKSLTLSPE